MVKPHGRDRRGRLAARDPGRRLRPALHRPGPPAVGPSTRARAGARPSRGAGDRGGAAAAHGDSAGRRVDRSKLSPPRSLLMARLVLRPMIGFNHGVPCGSVGTSILSTPCTGSPSRHWTARVWVARPSARGSTRSLTSCGRPVSRFRRSNGRGRLSRSAGSTPSPGLRGRQRRSKRSGSDPFGFPERRRGDGRLLRKSETSSWPVVRAPARATPPSGRRR